MKAQVIEGVDVSVGPSESTCPECGDRLKKVISTKVAMQLKKDGVHEVTSVESESEYACDCGYSEQW